MTSLYAFSTLSHFLQPWTTIWFTRYKLNSPITTTAHYKPKTHVPSQLQTKTKPDTTYPNPSLPPQATLNTPLTTIFTYLPRCWPTHTHTSWLLFLRFSHGVHIHDQMVQWEITVGEMEIEFYWINYDKKNLLRMELELWSGFVYEVVVWFTWNWEPWRLGSGS